MQQQLVRDPRTRALRVAPVMPVGAMQTYRVDLPLETHWRRADCAEVGCPQYHNGWVTRVLADSDDERLVRRAGRAWVSAKLDGGFMVFTFLPGTRCFRAATHRVQNERPALFRLAAGDWRWQGSPRVFNPADWVDHFANHQDRIATLVNRG